MTRSATPSIELIDIEQRDIFAAADIAEIALTLSQVTIDFATIRRVPRYCPEWKESDVEHSFMLGLVSVEVGRRYYPGLSSGLMAELSLVHDLPEKKTLDMATFLATDAELQAKYDRERNALAELQEELPPHIADLLTMYEEQHVPEARVVRHLDKLLPHAVNINGAGLEVMREDYGVETAEQMMAANQVNEDRFHAMFPDESHVILHGAHTVLANRFALQFAEV